MIKTEIFFDLDNQGNVIFFKDVTKNNFINSNTLILNDRPSWYLDKSFEYKENSFILMDFEKYDVLCIMTSEEYFEKSEKILNIIKNIVLQCINVKKINIQEIILPIYFFTDVFPKNIEDLIVHSLNTNYDNFLNIISEKYEKLKVLSLMSSSLNFVGNVHFNKKLEVLRLYDLEDNFCFENLNNIYGVKNLNLNMEICLLPKMLKSTTLWNNFELISIESFDSENYFQSFYPYLYNNNDELFYESYKMFHLLKDEELELIDINFINSSYVFSNILYRLINIQKRNINIYGINKKTSRVNPLFNTIFVNNKIHPKIKNLLSITLTKSCINSYDSDESSYELIESEFS